MEVKIGVQHAPREIVFDSNERPEDLEARVTTAMNEGTVLGLSDSRGGRIVLSGGKIGYIEIGASTERRVGFGAM